MGTFYLALGIIMILVGIAMRYMVNRRRFYRRGPGGLQHFDNYEKAVGTTCLEKVAKIVGFLMIFFGVVFFFMGLGKDGANDRTKTKNSKQSTGL